MTLLLNPSDFAYHRHVQKIAYSLPTPFNLNILSSSRTIMDFVPPADLIYTLTGLLLFLFTYVVKPYGYS